MTTKTRTPLEKLPYTEALKLADEALTLCLGRDIGDNTGWVFNGGVPYVTKTGKLLYNLTIQPSRYLSPVEEGELFHDGGIDATVDFLSRIGIVGIAHYVVRLDDADLIDRLREL